MGTTQCVDVHCHCLPGLDDGPEDMDQALTLCRALVAEGITRVIATPHQLGRFEGCFDAEQIHQAVRNLNAELIRSRIPLEVLPGAEIRVDERVPQWLAGG